MRLKFGTVPVCPGAAQPAYIGDATQDVLMRGHAEHYVNGAEGLTWACALSNVVKDPKNIGLFPHSVIEAFFTGKTTCYIMTGEKYKGVFIFIKYTHNYGTQLDMNDAHLSQRLAKENPEIFEQEILLKVPPKKKRKIAQPTDRRASSPKKPSRILHGANARAFAAGLKSMEEIQEMKSSMDAYERARFASIQNRKK